VTSMARVLPVLDPPRYTVRPRGRHMAGQAKLEYQRDYMRRRRNGSAGPSVAEFSFCNEPQSNDRLLVSDHDRVFICEGCAAMAAACIAKAHAG